MIFLEWSDRLTSKSNQESQLRVRLELAAHHLVGDKEEIERDGGGDSIFRPQNGRFDFDDQKGISSLACSRSV